MFASGYQITQLPLNKPVFLHSQGKPGFYKFCDHSCQTLQPLGKMAPSFSRSFYWALGCAGWAPGKTQPSTGYAPHNVLMDDVLVHFLTFHIQGYRTAAKEVMAAKSCLLFYQVSAGGRAKKDLVRHGAGPLRFALRSDPAGNRPLDVFSLKGSGPTVSLRQACQRGCLILGGVLPCDPR